MKAKTTNGVLDHGPYETEAQIRDTPMAREVRALFDAGKVKCGDPDQLVSGARMKHLTEACTAAGVELGAHDRRILRWLAGWEDVAIQVVIGLIARAAAEGDAEIAWLRRECDRLRAMRTREHNRCVEADEKLHQVATVKVWTNEDGRKFVFVDDVAKALGVGGDDGR